MNFLKNEYKLDLYGVEPSKIMLEQCSLRHKDLNIYKGDANNIPFQDNFFDGVFIECVFSLIEAKNAALNEIKRVLNPNGFLIISDIYLREKRQDINSSNVCGCFGGAMYKHEILNLLHHNHFQTELWQDKSGYLKDIAIKIIMSGGSLSNFYEMLGLKSDNQTKSLLNAKPGYYLLISKNKK